MIIVGIGFGPQNQKSEGSMSIKLVCTTPAGTSQPLLYGNGDENSDKITPKPATPPDKFTSFAQLWCDARPLVCEGSEETPQKNKVISSLCLSHFDKSRFAFRGTCQESTKSAKSDIKFRYDTNNTDFFRHRGQVVRINPEPNPQYALSGVEGLFYDTNIISYYGWAVSGVQMYLKNCDTIALNVRFQKFINI
jgi:hypothetical protein